MVGVSSLKELFQNHWQHWQKSSLLS